jgi:hypothetical protein
MRVRLYSDLHLEFMAPRIWRAFVARLPADCDVVVLAGDIATTGIADVLEVFCGQFRHVVFVQGNHELYNATPAEARDRIEGAVSRLPNLHWLDGAAVILDGQRFIGGTLWFPDSGPTAPYESDPRHMMSDFTAIAEFEPWVYRENERQREFLATNVCATDVVVTHHLPSMRCVHPKYAKSPLNQFFVTPMDRILDGAAAPLSWLHGHGHSSGDRVVGRTRVVANPFGYYGEEINREFDPDKTFEIARTPELAQEWR